MEKKYGRDVVDDLEARAGPKAWSQEELKEIRAYYRENIKRIERGIAPPEPRVRLAVSEVFTSVPTPRTVPSVQDLFKADRPPS